MATIHFLHFIQAMLWVDVQGLQEKHICSLEGILIFQQGQRLSDMIIIDDRSEVNTAQHVIQDPSKNIQIRRIISDEGDLSELDFPHLSDQKSEPEFRGNPKDKIQLYVLLSLLFHINKRGKQQRKT